MDTCINCDTPRAEAAHFCQACGGGFHRHTGEHRARPFAIQPAERVGQIALLSTLMPHTNREVADNYRWALGITGTLVAVLVLVGALPAAVLAGAALVPVSYLVYLYDVNLWEDAPVRVVFTLFALTGVLAALVSLVFFVWVFDGDLLALSATSFGGGFSIRGLLVFAVLLPIVGEVVRNIGPVLLARRPAFDDLIDGLTFGIAAGTAYAAFESVVVFRNVFTTPMQADIATWFVIVLNLMIVKAIIYGTATGLAVAAFSGLGDGYDGFTPAYVQNVVFAAGANVAYWLGVQLLAPLPFGGGLGLVWGSLIAVVLVLRVRFVLHAALMEAALDDAQRRHRSTRAVRGTGTCPDCEMPLLDGAMFCVSCGESLRAQSAMARHQLRHEDGRGDDADDAAAEVPA